MLTITRVDPSQAATPLANGVKLVLWGNETGNSEIVSAVNTYLTLQGSTSTEVYKFDRDTSDESGSVENLYETTFTLPSEVTISLQPDALKYTTFTHALIKDGNATPAWFLYDLANATGWDNGLESIFFDGPFFFNDKGEAKNFSHVSLYGNGSLLDPPGVGNPGTVPEPFTVGLMLSGVGCAGFVFRKRRKA